MEEGKQTRTGAQKKASSMLTATGSRRDVGEITTSEQKARTQLVQSSSSSPGLSTRCFLRAFARRSGNSSSSSSSSPAGSFPSTKSPSSSLCSSSSSSSLASARRFFFFWAAGSAAAAADLARAGARSAGLASSPVAVERVSLCAGEGWTQGGRRGTYRRRSRRCRGRRARRGLSRGAVEVDERATARSVVGRGARRGRMARGTSGRGEVESAMS